MLDQAPQRMTLVQKKDIGKLRNVVCGEMQNYLRMCFLTPLICGGFKGASWSPLFMNTAEEKQMWLRILRCAQNTSLLKVPIDQSQFDYAPSRAMIRMFFDKVVDYSQKYGTDEEFAISKLLRTSMMSEGSTVRVLKELVQYRQGFASGWRWTPFIGTIFNKTKFDIMQELVERDIHRP